MSTNLSVNISATSVTNTGFLTGLCIFSASTILVNSVILIASKYTTAGKSAILVFMRCLCVADLLIGLFGLFKSLILMHVHHRWINCFLPDSIFVSASTAICLTILWLNIDSYLRLTRPFGYGNSMDKGNVIIAMMLVWNGSFIFGFLPELGWNNDEYGCNFFTFYSVIYTIIVSFIWTMCITGSLVFQVCLRRILRRIKSDSEFMTSNSAQYKLYSQLVNTVGNDMFLLVGCYLPFLIYICIYFIKSRFEETETASKNMIYFLPVFLFRSFISAFIHSYGTIRLQTITPNRQGSFGKLFKHSAHTNNSNEQPAVFFSNSSKGYNDSDEQVFLRENPSRQKLVPTLSNATITTVVESRCTCLTRHSNSSSISSCRNTHRHNGDSLSCSMNSMDILQPDTSSRVTTKL